MSLNSFNHTKNFVCVFLLKNKRNLIIISSIFLLICSAIISPYFKWAYCRPETLSSIDTYNNKEYLSFDSGIEMQKFIKDFEFLPTNDPTAFYYIDNSKFFGEVLHYNWTGDGIHFNGSIYKNWYEFIINEIKNI